MLDLGLDVLFKGKNMARLLGGLGVALKISAVSVIISLPLGILLGVLMTCLLYTSTKQLLVLCGVSLALLPDTTNAMSNQTIYPIQERLVIREWAECLS